MGLSDINDDGFHSIFEMEFKDKFSTNFFLYSRESIIHSVIGHLSKTKNKKLPIDPLEHIYTS